MKSLARSLLTLAVLVTTALLLVGDASYSTQDSCEHPLLEVPFTVRGSCGPDGTLTLVSSRNACEVFVAGASEELQIPTHGRFTGEEGPRDFLRGHWELSDEVSRIFLDETSERPLPDGGTGPIVYRREIRLRRCEATKVASQVRLSCEEHRTLQPDSPVAATCEVLLTPK